MEKLKDFKGAIGAAATFAPDEYSEWSYITYQNNMEDIASLWGDLRAELSASSGFVDFIDAKLAEMFAAFEAGEKERGRDAAWDIYNFLGERME